MQRSKVKNYKHRKLSHFKTRLMERFGYNITDDEVESITNDITNYISKPIKILQDTGNSFHILYVGGNRVVVLFDWEYNVPLTVYRESWFKKLPNGTYDLFHKAKRKDIRLYERSVTFSIKTGIKNRP